MDEDKETEAPPKKIALKVPSLFIKSKDTPSSSDKMNDAQQDCPKKPKRPMPASIRKKLEEAKKVEAENVSKPDKLIVNGNKNVTGSEKSDDEDLSHVISTENDTSLVSEPEEKEVPSKSVSQQTPPKKEVTEEKQAKIVKKAMPASAKLKVQNGKSNALGLDDNNDSSMNVSATLSTPSVKKSRPMPASARKKLEQSEAQNDDGNEDSNPETKNKINDVEESKEIKPKNAANRPVPASVRKQLEEKKAEDTDESLNDDDQSKSAEGVESHTVTVKKSKKPMPASARRKMEEATINDDNCNKKPEDESEVFSSSSKVDMDSSISSSYKAMPASSRRISEEDSHEEKSSQQTDSDKNEAGKASQHEEGKKINISLGGIKFPTFNRPMPASVKKKVDNKLCSEGATLPQNTTEDNEKDFKIPPNNDNEKAGDSTVFGRSRRSVPNRELLALEDDKFKCEYCDSEFYSMYSLTKHKESHFRVKKPKENSAENCSDAKQKSLPSQKKTVAKKDTKYKDWKGACPCCDKRISNSRKLRKHVSSCKRRHMLRCKLCDKQFKSKPSFEEHNKQFHTEGETGLHEMDQSKNAINSSPPSFVSEKSDGGSAKGSGNVSNESKEAKSSSRAVASTLVSDQRAISFKRKIASVLSSFGNRDKQKSRKKNVDKKEDMTHSDGEEDDDNGPPRKKIALTSGSSSESKSESIKGLAMPASVRKKLENRENSKQEKSTDSKSESKKSTELHELECEICHRVFTSLSNRQRHEMTVHSIETPRSRVTSVTTSKNRNNESHGPKSSKSKTSASKLTLESLPQVGKCPICFKYFNNRLRRHCRNVHKVPSIHDSVSFKIPNRKLAKKSFKIYKTASDKLKKKLTSSSTPASSSARLHTKNHSSKSKRQTSPVLELGDNDEYESMPQLEPIPVPVLTNSVEPTTTKKSVTKSQNEFKPPSSSIKPKPLAIAVAAASSFKCGCCDKTFTVKSDLTAHMSKRVPKQKRLFACTVCLHMFSHEEDCTLHIQFRHTDLVSGMVLSTSQLSTTNNVASSSTNKHSDRQASKPDKSTCNKPPSSFAAPLSVKRNLRGSSTITHDNDFNSTAAASCPNLSIEIPRQEKQRAERVYKQAFSSTTDSRISGVTKNSTTSSRRKAHSPSPTYNDPEEPMDTQDDHYDAPANADDSLMDTEESGIGIAITSTFSQKISTRKEVSPAPESLSEDGCKMPCSICNEVFYSFEALRKHELYFHNVRTSKMCPICGVYPHRLSRHLLAHENETVRCSCALCRLNFSDFSVLLKHNLEYHPGPDGGAITTANTSSEKMSTKKSSRNAGETIKEEKYKCQICDRECENAASARRHIRRTHPERGDDAEFLISKIERSHEKDNDDDEDMDQILAETSEKLKDPDWEDDGNDNDSSPPSPEFSMAASPAPPSAAVPEVTHKPSRAMPASARAKLDAAKKRKELESAIESSFQLDRSKNDAADTKPTSKRPMPASIRAKLETKNNQSKEAILENSKTTESTESKQSKPAKRPMPASVRAKMVAQQSGNKVSVTDDAAVSIHSDSHSVRSFDSHEKPSPKPSTSWFSRPRAMPASAKKRMLNKAELKEVPPTAVEDGFSSPPPSPEPIDLCDDEFNSDGGNVAVVEGKSLRENEKQQNVSSFQEVVTLEDDADDDDLAIIKESLPTKKNTSFNIADEIAEHNRSVQMAMGSKPIQEPKETEYNVISFYNCKLCLTKAPDLAGVREHIHQNHAEYGDEHTENLYEQITEKTPIVKANDIGGQRNRRSTTNYNKSYRHDLDEEDHDDEVIVSRGTSTRPRGEGRSATVTTEDLPYHQGSFDNSATSPSISHCVENGEPGTDKMLYACKFCGQRKDTAGKIKQHITKSHRELKGRHSDDVVQLEAGKEHEFVPMFSKEASSSNNVSRPQPVAHYKCKVCQRTMDKKQSLVQHINRSHPELKSSGHNPLSFIQEMFGENELIHTSFVDGGNEQQVETYDCGFCIYQTADENDYVRHYINHTGVSPYQCQFCSATFTKNQQLTSHVTREHTGAEFLNEDEAEISMEEMVGVGEISVSSSIPIQIEQPKVISLNRTFGENAPTSKRRPGPASRKSKSKMPVVPEPDPINNGGADAGTNNDHGESNMDYPQEEDEQPVSFPLPYQGDLSSLLTTLGGSEPPGGSLADLDGGMDLD